MGMPHKVVGVVVIPNAIHFAFDGSRGIFSGQADPRVPASNVSLVVFFVLAERFPALISAAV